MGWLYWWSRRKQLYISNGAATTQSNYQLKLTINYGSGPDSTGNIYCNSQVRSDFGDIRFTSSDGSTQLYYWIDDYSLVSGSKCNVWVQIPSIPTGTNSTSIYMYYNNPPMTTLSNGPYTFPILFDDFSGGFSKWTHESGCSYGGGTAGTTTGPAGSVNPVMYMTRTDASCGSGATTPLNYLYGGWHVSLYKTSTQAGAGIVIDIDYSRNYTLYYVDTGGVVNFNGPSGLIGSYSPLAIGSWHTFDITRDTTGYWTIYIDNVSRITGTNNTYTTNTKLGIRTTSWPSGSTDYADNVFYRNYVSPGPAFSTTGNEEWADSFLIAGN